MRLTKVLDLGAGRSATLHELRVSDVRNALAQADGLRQMDLKSLADPAQVDKVLGVLGDCVVISGADRDSLSFSEIESIWNGFKEVNSAFFKLLAMAGLADPAPTGIS